MPSFKPEIGKRFGKIVVIGEDHSRKHLCRCDCGTVKMMCVSGLRSGRTSTCGTCNRSNDRFKSVIGMRYGHLVVVEEHQVCRNRRVMVRCDCGNVVERVLSNLKRGQTKSCGCQKVYRHSHGSIYYLVDPITNQIRYVGQTVQQMSVRLNDHVCTGPGRGRLRRCVAKSAWIK